MNLKFVKNYKTYLAEQDFSDFQEPGQQPAPAPKVNVYTFLFIDTKEDKKSGYKYPDGSFSKMYSTYEISEKDLTDWIDDRLKADKMSDNEIKVKSKSLKEYISGDKPNVSPDVKEIVNKFKNEVQSDMCGTKVEDTEVIFSSDGVPTTNSIDVTFLEL